ncbi:MAG: type II toxin-antitoxin system VapC family toxin [Betaproteobacteria bacterium]
MESLPRNILADTGPLFSLLHVDDGDHERAVEFSRAFTGLLITTWPVIAEVCYLLGQSNRRGIGILLGMIEDQHLTVADLGPPDVRYVRALMAKYDTMDLADASLVAVGERLGILDIVSLDRRDFSRYRTRGRQAFRNHFPTRG